MNPLGKLIFWTLAVLVCMAMAYRLLVMEEEAWISQWRADEWNRSEVSK